ncbi:ABC-F family ATP-binding cassette domain-containing protein [Sporolactobacillus shoreae]|uniref:ABC-F family ATP-binding cassette domain-containing protein n=1 Tax=Sporolactobacillus shoreae TaxID=1465501 RepID=A0A4Z0GJV2_9BACL|nr:ABC-F family ATP-binding cassette domain-containing protein [Sporolactobacillus shoreae]TGA97124.1 ABC-F family ATP-binding cassette domain-containing protein [Sporolactobacillus shoreae]
MLVCQTDHIGKNIAGNEILHDVSFSVNDGEKVAIVGANGSGKTTLFNVITRIETPDRGTVAVKKGVTVGYLRQLPEGGNRTVHQVLENAFKETKKMEQKMRDLEASFSTVPAGKLEKLLADYAGLQEKFQQDGGYDMDYRVNQVADGLGITPLMDQVFTSLSGGEKTKVGLGFQLLTAPDLLLLDEPTNHLDILALQWLEQFIRQYKGTVLLVSHDRFFLDRTIDKVLDLEDGEITVYQGNYSVFVKEKQERLLLAFAAYEDQQKKIKKMKETIKRLKEWANQAVPPNAGLHRRAKSMEKALDRIERLKRPKMEADKMALDFGGSRRTGDRVLSCKDLSVSFDGRSVFSDVDLELRYRDRLAIIGPNGSGKTTLLRCLLGRIEPQSGEIRHGTNLNIGILSQHVFENPEDQSRRVIDVFREHARLTEGEARHELANFLFYGSDVFKKIGTLSGGERVRIRLADLMMKKINVLILDEPTNHLDIESREVLEEAVRHFKGTVLAVSHDRYFLKKCFNQIYWLQNGQLLRYSENL